MPPSLHAALAGQPIYSHSTLSLMHSSLPALNKYVPLGIFLMQLNYSVPFSFFISYLSFPGAIFLLMESLPETHDQTVRFSGRDICNISLLYLDVWK